jgi:hypothetical protein
MSAITAIPAALCLRPSARDPPPISALLKTKIKPQFDRAVDRAVEALFPIFQGIKSGPISALFSHFHCAVGRGSQRIMVCILADCCLLIAMFSKIVQLLPFLAGRKQFNLPFVRPKGQAQNLATNRNYVTLDSQSKNRTNFKSLIAPVPSWRDGWK